MVLVSRWFLFSEDAFGTTLHLLVARGVVPSFGLATDITLLYDA